ncbi:DDE-type integrase/transposase/recombinase [Pseudomonas sp. JM0905a]|uniref:Mu transposase C-terminal domain-containing protein n=1 Tax=Pseudomonas sp. JM0905a TaxID=2772484 RepID=UPI0016875B44|nr:Mu transposase C-terminal domain-containing protein [Pseudomonas sp. JM0905a]MBD2837099.1 DDE-type integrase/transposase/recombinase [Pseudomonas sp. JM0905a]
MKGVETEGHDLNRNSISLQIGEFVCHRQLTYRLTATVGFSHIVGVDVVIGTSKLLPIAELKRVKPDRVKGPYANYSLDDIADELWAEAERRMAIIQPLLQGKMFESGAVETRARESGVSKATVYRWLSAYIEGDQFLSLMPRKRGWRKGTPRVSEEIERIIRNTIAREYLTTERKSQKDVHAKVVAICEAQGLKPPSIPTVSERIKMLPRKQVLKARGYSDIARDTYEAEPGSFSADYPLHRIQIDHTPADVIIVDDEYRMPIGRPHVSLAIDMYTRMIVGYFISLDAPSAVSVAMCLVHAMLPKHKWLNLHGVEGEWNAWGKPYEVHTDNGPDFKKESLIKSCILHGIEREFRPRETPTWGGQIERLMNTKARAFATLPGATGRNVDERGDVDSDKEAVVSFAAFEKWFLAQVIKYNNQPHSGIEFMPPKEKWNEAFFGSSLRKPICGLPPIPEDPITLELDFLPSTSRTVQTYGVEWDAFYYAEVLRPWVGHQDPKTKKATRLFFRRDPRDVNCIWFFEPRAKKYYRIPITTGPFPGVSVASYVKAKRKVKEHGLSLVDDVQIKKMLNVMRGVVEEEAGKSKAARRLKQSNKNKAKGTTPAKVYVDSPPANQVPEPAAESVEADTWGDDEVGLYGGVS